MKNVDARNFWLTLIIPATLLALLLLYFSRTPGGLRPEVVRYFNPQEILRARAFTQARYSLAGLRTLLAIGFYAAVVFLPVGAALAAGARRLAGGRYYFTLLLLLAVITVSMRVLSLPLDFYGEFRLERWYGLSTQTVGAWFSDWGKDLAVGTILSAISFAGLFWIIRTRGLNWWLFAGVAFALWILLTTMAKPLVIDPLFHRFTPLANGAVKEKTLALAKKAEMDVGEILVMDASRRTTTINAYFTGFGATRRIVLYDNLLRKFPPEGVEMVLAHEIGHWKRGHVNKTLVLISLGGFVFFYVAARILESMRGAGPLGLTGPGDPRALLVILLLATLVSTLALPVRNHVSRGFEREADSIALHLTGDPRETIRLHQELARANLADLTPHPYIRWFLYTHPPVAERIAAAEGFVP